MNTEPIKNLLFRFCIILACVYLVFSSSNVLYFEPMLIMWNPPYIRRKQTSPCMIQNILKGDMV